MACALTSVRHLGALPLTVVRRSPHPTSGHPCHLPAMWNDMASSCCQETNPPRVLPSVSQAGTGLACVDGSGLGGTAVLFYHGTVTHMCITPHLASCFDFDAHITWPAGARLSTGVVRAQYINTHVGESTRDSLVSMDAETRGETVTLSAPPCPRRWPKFRYHW